MLLLVDADESRTRALLDACAAGGFDARITRAPAEAAHALEVAAVAGLVLDPTLAGPDFASRLRRRSPAAPVVGWLPVASSTQAAELLEAGADDVLDATMGERELAARLRRAVHGRTGRLDGRIEVDRLVVDPDHGEATWDGRRLELSGREREVLHVLAGAAGHTVRRDVLYRQVWGYAMARGDRSVDVNVKRLRAKLSQAGVGVEIKTAPGVGYRLETVTAL